MTTIRDVCEFLQSFAPLTLAEEWDNVGLLIGRHDRPAQKVMTCLTITPASAGEAVEEGVDLIVAHHPLPFRPLGRLTEESTPGRLVLTLAEAKIAVYSPHTAFDSAAAGINQQLAEALGLTDIAPLVCADERQEIGSGRHGRAGAAMTVAEAAARLKDFLRIPSLRLVGDPQTTVQSAALACGSGGEFLRAASRAGCDLFVTGETSFHTLLEAEALGMALLLTGHYASERFAVERLAEILAGQFPQAVVWASRCEQDPLKAI